MKIPIKNIHALNRRISDLKLKQYKLESQLDDNFHRLNENFMGMGINSLFRKRSHAGGFWTEILTLLVENDKFKQGVKNLFSKLTDRLGDALK